jgi:hypothetical protein
VSALRSRCVVTAALALAALAAVAAGGPATNSGVEIVATGIPRPLQLAVDGGFLLVLSPGLRGDSAGELYRFDLAAAEPVDLGRQPRLRIPFADSRMATLGSLALRPSTAEIFVGEENGQRVWRLAADGRLSTYATGLRRLGGGSTLAFDAGGRLVIVDYVDPRVTPPEERLPGLEQFRDEDYRGPLVFRLELDPDIALPRRLDRLAPLFPRGWGGPAGGGLLPRLISVAASPDGTLVLLTSGGELVRLGADGVLVPWTRLPAGQYNRTSMVMAPDGTLYVSGGFHVSAVFRVTPPGRVSVVADNLGDPEGVALDARGDLYVAESSFHRIVRVRLP